MASPPSSASVGAAAEIVFSWGVGGGGEEEVLGLGLRRV